MSYKGRGGHPLHRCVLRNRHLPYLEAVHLVQDEQVVMRLQTFLKENVYKDIVAEIEYKPTVAYK